MMPLQKSEGLNLVGNFFVFGTIGVPVPCGSDQVNTANQYLGASIFGCLGGCAEARKKLEGTSTWEKPNCRVNRIWTGRMNCLGLTEPIF